MTAFDQRASNISTINRLLASARAMPGQNAGIPASVFWPALLLTVLDTRGWTLCDLLRLQTRDFQPGIGELRIRQRSQVVHPRTAEALVALCNAAKPYAPVQLFPWPFDTLPALKTLGKHFRFLRRRVSLPSQISLRWLRNVAKADPHVISRIDPHAQYEFDPSVKTLGTEYGHADLRNGEVHPVEGVHAIEVPAAISLVRFFEDVYAPLRLSKTAYERPRSSLQWLKRYSAVEPHFGFLTDDSIEGFTTWLVQRSTLKNVTINVHVRNILSLWRFAWKKRRVADLPRDVSFLRVPKRSPECWSVDELRHLIAVAAQQPGWIGVIPANVFWPTLLAFLFVTGVRIGAARSLPREALDLETGWLIVPAECQKQLADQRIQIGPDCLQAMARLLEFHRGPMLFNTPFKSPETYRKHLRHILERAGMSSGRRDLFHKLRRTCGTFIAKELGEQAAQHYLGHSSLNVTRAYIDPRKLDRPQAVAVLPRVTLAAD